MLDEADIPRSQCFFTNVFMGLIDGPSAVGRFPGANDSLFVQRCRDFLVKQLNIVQPRLILTLGKEVLRVIAPLSPELVRVWSGTRNLRDLDERGAAYVIPVSFSGTSETTAVVALTHPAHRPLNVGSRRFGSWVGHEAELALIRQAVNSVSYPRASS